MSELEAACEVLNRHRWRSISWWQSELRDYFLGDEKTTAFEAIAIARALEPDPQAEADRELGAALRAVLAVCRGTRYGISFSRTDESPRWAAVFDAAHDGNWSVDAEGETDAEALRALAARLAGEAPP